MPMKTVNGILVKTMFKMVEKSHQLPKDIQWHFIGHLQSNKCKTVAAIPNLYVVETVDSSKKADSLNKACQSVGRKDPLRIFVQVNTSEEEVKSGVLPLVTVEVCKHILENCPQLKLFGLMTIWHCLVDCKKRVENELNLKDLELSMGMSSDYMGALKLGATNVRVGTTIFGGRLHKSEIKNDKE
ncbi:unnamed protein product [Rhizopus stolonifer]